MTDIENEFTWPDAPPQDWWQSQGAALKLDEGQIRFAASLYLLGGADSKKNSRAATLAGLNIDRTAAFRLARSVGIRRLLTMAEEIKASKRPPVTEDEIDRQIDKLIRSPDALTVARGIELRDKRQKGTSGAIGDGELDHPADLYFHIFTGIQSGKFRRDFWPVVWAEMVLDNWWTPLIAQMVPYLAKHHPQMWAERRQGLAAWDRERLAELERSAPLTADQIYDITRKNLMPLLMWLDASILPDKRDGIEEQLVRAGLMEPMSNAA